ncbi:MAG: GNAT family N-acetyltransferase [Alteromonadaceae bacterium]|nr:GNAT family N-acetyltransferase [Alteromonadaceae bacterium]
MVTTTDFQGQGIWHSLLDYVIFQFQKVKSYTDVASEVAVTNKKAIATYKRYGFVITKKITSYYQDGTDAFSMSKKLSGSCN